MNKKLSLSYRVDQITPGHIYLSIFCALVLAEYKHGNVTRAKSGELVLRVDEFGPFLNQTKPHIVSFGAMAPVEMVEEYTGVQFLDEWEMRENESETADD